MYSIYNNQIEFSMGTSFEFALPTLWRHMMQTMTMNIENKEIKIQYYVLINVH